MPTRRTKNVVAVTPGGPITNDMILGYITMFYMPDQPVSASKLNRLWIGEGLPHDMIPNTRKAVNAFQVACRSVETRRKRDSASEQIEVEVDPVLEDEDRCIYQVTSLVRNHKDEVVDHPKALRVTFDKHAEVIEWEPLDRLFDADRTDEIGEAIREFYDKNSSKVPASRVREAVRKLMDNLDATNLRKKSGGVYLVPAKGRESLESLQTVFAGIWPDAEVNMIPCMNGEDQRSMVERHFDFNVSAEVDEMMATTRDALAGRNRSIRKDAVSNLLVRHKQLLKKRETYAEMLNTDLGEIGTKMELLGDQLEALVVAKAEE